MGLVKNIDEIKKIRESALLVSKTLGLIAKEIKEGITTLELDKIAEEYIRSNNASPGFLGLYGFPNTLCVSPNSQVVHGIPNDKPLKNGDIVSIDCGVLKEFLLKLAQRICQNKKSGTLSSTFKFIYEALGI